MPIEHISDTARWVAVYRAMETDREDAHFRDPYARQLAGERGEEIVNTMKRGREMAWAMVVRTQVFDELILDSITTRGIRQVINLAAGLDTRPWRLELDPSIVWLDVDLPGILNYKLEQLAGAKPVCQYSSLTADLTDAAVRASVLGRVAESGLPTLVVTEGLLIYLKPEQVGELATALHDVPNIERWLIDLASPKLLEIMMKYWGNETRDASAAFQFAPAEGTKFFEPFGWREAVFRSAFVESQRLKREMRLMWLWKLLLKISPEKKRQEAHRMSGYAMLEPLRGSARATVL